MIPASVLSALGISFAELLASAPEAGDLMKALDIARGTGPPGGVFFRFANAFRAAVPGASWASISESYREAKGWASRGSAWAQYASSTQIDPNMYRPVTSYGSFAADYGGFITEVRVTLTDPATGDSRDYGIKIHDFVTWNVLDINAYAISAVDDIIGQSPTVGGATDVADLHISVTITDMKAIV